MNGCVSVVPRERGYGKCEQRCGLAGADVAADGPIAFLMLRAAAISRAVRVYSFLPFILPFFSPSLSPSSAQLYQHDKEPENHWCHISSFLPARYPSTSKGLIFFLGLLGTSPCFVYIHKTHSHTYTHAALFLSHCFLFNYISKLPASMTSIPSSQPQDESATLRHCRFEKKVSGQC